MTDGSTLGEKKQRLRKHFKAVRKAIPAGQRARIDDAIARRVVGLPEFSQADVVLSYLSLGSEIETRGIIRAAWEAGKAVALPWCVPHARRMRWFRITSFDGLVRSSFGVEEPKPDPENEQRLDAGERMIALVPGLTFDARGYRLGYGGGYYDVFLEGFAGTSAGLCREAQFSADGVHALGEFDRPADIVVTERRVVRP